MNAWPTVILVTSLAVISPGADFAMVTRTSLMESRRAGLWVALGIGCGVLIHVAYTLLDWAWSCNACPGFSICSDMQAPPIWYGSEFLCGAAPTVQMAIGLSPGPVPDQAGAMQSKAMRQAARFLYWAF